MSDEQELYLKQFLFDFYDSYPYPAFLVQAKRGSGKTFTAKSIAAKATHIHRWVSICGTRESANFWSQAFGSAAAVRNADEEGMSYLQSRYKFQEDTVAYYRKILKIPIPEEFNLGIILDDCAAIKFFAKHKFIGTLLSNARNALCLVIIISQYPKQLWPEVRSQFDFLFLSQNSQETLRLLHKETIQEPASFREFKKIFKTVTGHKDSRTGKKVYNSLVFQNRNAESELDRMFFVYTPESMEELTEMKVGSEVWRQYCQENWHDPDVAKYEQERKKLQRQQRLERYRSRQQGGDFLELDDFGDGMDDWESGDDEESAYDTVSLAETKGGLKAIHLQR